MSNIFGSVLFFEIAAAGKRGRCAHDTLNPCEIVALKIKYSTCITKYKYFLRKITLATITSTVRSPATQTKD